MWSKLVASEYAWECRVCEIEVPADKDVDDEHLMDASVCSPSRSDSEGLNRYDKPFDVGENEEEGGCMYWPSCELLQVGFCWYGCCWHRCSC